MSEHESWCCRSPLSPCAQEGGCSGSCNCGADESIEGDGVGPSLGELRASSANLMAASFAARIIDDSLRMGLPLELVLQLAYERIVSGDV
jgi:hypothetical protein